MHVQHGCCLCPCLAGFATWSKTGASAFIIHVHTPCVIVMYVHTRNTTDQAQEKYVAEEKNAHLDDYSCVLCQQVTERNTVMGHGMHLLFYRLFAITITTLQTATQTCDVVRPHRHKRTRAHDFSSTDAVPSQPTYAYNLPEDRIFGMYEYLTSVSQKGLLSNDDDDAGDQRSCVLAPCALRSPP